MEINFLCVHKKLRSKRLTPVLISEITRRVNLKGIFQAVYTAGVFIPRPVSTCRYFHRSLNPKKLIDVGFSALSKNMNMSRTIKFYRVPDKPSLAGLRQYVKKDIRQVYPLYTKYMSKFDLVPVYTQNELAHWLTPVEDVVDCYVVEVSSPIYLLLRLICNFLNFCTEIERREEKGNSRLLQFLHSSIYGDESCKAKKCESGLLVL